MVTMFQVLSERHPALSGSDTSVTCIDVEFDRRAVGGTSLASALSDHQPEVSTLWNIGATRRAGPSAGATQGNAQRRGANEPAVQPRADAAACPPPCCANRLRTGSMPVGDLDRSGGSPVSSHLLRETLVPGLVISRRLLAAGLRDEEVSLVVPGPG